MITSDDSATLRHAAELLEVDAECLRQCHNVDPLQPTWEDEDKARADHDDALCTALRLRMIAKRAADNDSANEIARLQRTVAAEKERADYAWRNTNTIEKARQEEMAKRDAAEAALEHLRKLAKASLGEREREARAVMSLENAQANYSHHAAESREHLAALVAASKADKALRDALATPNVKVSGLPQPDGD